MYRREASLYNELMEDTNFHESNRFATEEEQKTGLVDIDETVCFYSGKRTYDLAEPH